MDVNRLLEGFLGQAGAKGGRSSGGGGAGDLINQARGALSGGGSGSSGASGGIGKALNSLPGGLGGGAAAGGLVALMLGNKKARKFGGKALTYGGLAVVGGLAYKAWSDYQSGKKGSAVSMSELPAPPQNSPFDPASQRDHDGGDLRLTLVRAMIAAAKSDGHIDQAENEKIQAQIQAMELEADEKAFLFDQLNAPSDPVAIARLAEGEEQGAEIYLASALAVDIDTPEERRYMERLGDALRLPGGLREELDSHAEQAKNSA